MIRILAATSLVFLASSAQAQTVYPIDRAEILSGSRFDFKVEFAGRVPLQAVRVTCTGELFMCLGQEAMTDLRAPLRAGAGDAPLEKAIRAALSRKPKGHDYDYSRHRVRGQMSRKMTHTGR